MRYTQVVILTLLFSLFLLPQTFAQEYTQWELPEGAKFRLGKGELSVNLYNEKLNTYWFSPDNNRLTVVSKIGIWLYDVKTGDELKLLPISTGFDDKVIGSPDGKLIVSINRYGYRNVITHFWDANTGKLKTNYIDPNSGITTIAFNPDGSEFVTNGLDNTIRLWNTDTGEHKTIKTGGKNWRSILYSPDGQILAAEIENGIILYDLNTGVLKKSIEKSDDKNIITIAFSPDGKLLAVRSYRSIELWNTITGDLKSSFRDSTGPHSAIAFSPDGSLLATADHKKVLLWDVQSGKRRTTLSGHKNHIGSVTFSPNSKIVASTSWGEIRLWSSNTGEHKVTLNGEESFGNPVFSPNGLNLISQGESNLYLWKIDINNLQNSELEYMITGHYPNVNSVAFSIDGHTLASAHYWEKIRLWDVEKRKLRTLCKGNPYSLIIQSAVFSPDGKTLASLNINTQSSASQAQVLLWDANTGEYQVTLKGHGKAFGKTRPYHPNSLVFSPDGETLVSGSLDGTVRFWNARTKSRDSFLHGLQGAFFGHHKAVLKGHKDHVLSVALSPDGSTIASVSLDSTIRLWDAHTRKLKSVIEGNNDTTHSVAFSSDGKTLMIGDRNQILLWDIIASQPITSITLLRNRKTAQYKTTIVKVKIDPMPRLREDIIPAPVEDDFRSIPMTSFTVSPDGNALAVGCPNGVIVLLDLPTFKVKKTVNGGSQNGVKSLAFSPDGRTLASGSYNGTILIWDINE